MKKLIEKKIKKIITSLKMPDIEVSLQIPKNKDHGDLSTNVAFILSKHLDQNPMEIASIIAEKLSDDGKFARENETKQNSKRHEDETRREFEDRLYRNDNFLSFLTRNDEDGIININNVREEKLIIKYHHDNAGGRPHDSPAYALVT